MGRELKALRAKYDLTQQDMAKLLGISVVTYRNKENLNTDFSLTEAKKISEQFNKPIEEIFFEQ